MNQGQFVPASDYFLFPMTVTWHVTAFAEAECGVRRWEKNSPTPNEIVFILKTAKITPSDQASPPRNIHRSLLMLSHKRDSEPPGYHAHTNAAISFSKAVLAQRLVIGQR